MSYSKEEFKAKEKALISSNDLEAKKKRKKNRGLTMQEKKSGLDMIH